MFSILRYPLLLSLVVDFAVAFDLFWSNGSSSFNVGGGTADLSWSRELFEPQNIALYVTEEDNMNGEDPSGPYKLGPEDGPFGNLSIEIPRLPGNFVVTAYNEDHDPSEFQAQSLNTTRFIVQFPNDTSSTSQTSPPPATTSSSSNNPTMNTSAAGSTTPTSTGPTPSPATDLSASNKSIIIGSVVGGVMFLILASLLILIAIRRCRTRRDTVQFYENKMVRPSAAAVRDPTWEPLRLDSDPDSKHDDQHDDPLPEYGYSNYDVIEKADYRSISPLPNGAMSLKPRLPKIIMTPATPSQRDSSVLASVRPLSLISEWEPVPALAGPAGPSSLPVPPPPSAIPSGNPELEHLQVEINELRREMDESENIGDPAKRRQMMMEIANKLTLLERLVQGR